MNMLTYTNTYAHTYIQRSRNIPAFTYAITDCLDICKFYIETGLFFDSFVCDLKNPSQADQILVTRQIEVYFMKLHSLYLF